MLNIPLVRDQFPILREQVNERPLVYLDNAATTQKPLTVLEASRNYYERLNANIHRGVHALSQKATAAHEQARVQMADFIHAPASEEVLFTSGCTESINLVAQTMGYSGYVGPGDEIVISALEHHSNIVPWQMLCERTGSLLKVIPLHAEGGLDLSAFAELLNHKTKVVSVCHISNALGTINPVEKITELARKNNPDTVILIDGAQALPHLDIDVQKIDCDFYACSGHKAYGPTGIGALWGKAALLNTLQPWKGGGEMIKEVTFEKTTYNQLPFKYEAGTPNIEGAIALGAALRFMNDLGRDDIREHENNLLERCLEGLRSREGVNIMGGRCDRGAVVSFIVEGVHHYDLGVLLDQMGIAVRTGHHCCQPLMNLLGVSGTVRASFAVYNTPEEVDFFLKALDQSLRMLR